MSTIKINQLATSDVELTDFIITADGAGVATKNTVQGLSDAINATLDSSPTQGSTNAVQSGGVYDALVDITPLKEDLSLNFKILPDGAIPSSINGASWSVLNGTIINTPSETAFPINDGSLELWTDANNLTDWDKLTPSGGSLDRVTDSIDGTFAAKITVNSSGSRTEIRQSMSAIPLGSFYNVRAFAKCNIDGTRLRINNDSQLNNISQTPLSSTAFTEMLASSYRKTASGDLLIQNYGNANKEFTIDNISVGTVTGESVLSLTEDLGNLKRVKTYVTPSLGSFAGLVTNVDNIANPQNYIALIKVGADNNQLLLWKMVDGVLSQIQGVTLTDYSSEGLYELKQVTKTTYQVYAYGRPQGTPITIDEPTINKNVHHGMISMVGESTFEYFSCTNVSDTVVVPDGAELKDYYKFVSSGDTLSLAENGSYNLAAGDSGFNVIPSGTSENYTTINGNGSVLTGGLSSIRFTDKEYIEVSDIFGVNATAVLYPITGTTRFIKSNRIVMTTTSTTAIDYYKNQSGPSDLEFNDCVAYSTITNGVITVDGFEDWGVSRVTYNRCIAYGFKNGTSDYNNGHGFESYSGNSATDEHCEDITYNQCVAFNNRVGFSAEGGVPQTSGVRIKAIDCIAYNNEIADAGGVDGSTIEVTENTLPTRTGSVTTVATINNSTLSIIENLMIKGYLADSDGEIGTENQVLTRQGSKILWV
tara:strand:+ start:180 stop:2294 length:2115 start_codon:yes stop_codon:yes gene_type:complete